MRAATFIPTPTEILTYSDKTMRYAIIDIGKAAACGIPQRGHRTLDDSSIVVNERELLFIGTMSDMQPEEIAAELGGELYSESEILTIINGNQI